jgi:lipid II isoglutaminyl synthase (glutamine-hydrolysing)
MSPSSGSRVKVASAATRLVNLASRAVRLGGGTVAGGRVGVRIAPDLLARLTEGRAVALVSGTNGKTTTTRLLATALETQAQGPVVTNATGSNMPAGHVAALVGTRPAQSAVLEVDEGYVPTLLRSVHPVVLVLLNLSRDQLDRTNEVRMLANRWREALTDSDTVVVANADDPLVAWGAGSARQVVWVAAGAGWRADAVGCPSCGERIHFDSAGGWACASCVFHRPQPELQVEGSGSDVVACLADGRRLPVLLSLPGRFNQANAVMAAAAAEVMGVPTETALAAMVGIDGVAGRFSIRQLDGVSARLMLAKNPAGWAELLELIDVDTAPVVIGINARIADGKDPSWLWDVPFERLAGRPVVASGERCLDLSVRLHYAEVPHEVVPDPVAAIRHAGSGRHERVDFVGNYTTFFDLAARR